MARYPDLSNPETLKKRLKKGRGSGEGANYIPLFHPTDFGSRGHSFRAPGWKTARSHWFVSSHELHLALILDASAEVKGFREQFYLPLEQTLAIASSQGLSHPAHPESKRPFPMTTDFVIELHNGESRAWTVKPFSELVSDRVWEKFEIERIFWSRRGIPWGIVTEREIPMTVVKNIDAIHDYYDLASHPRIDPVLANRIGQRLLPEILKEDTRLVDLTARLEEQLNLQLGDCLAAIKHLIARRIWTFDLHKPFDSTQPLVLTGYRSYSLTTPNNAGVSSTTENQFVATEDIVPSSNVAFNRPQAA